MSQPAAIVPDSRPGMYRVVQGDTVVIVHGHRAALREARKLAEPKDPGGER